MTLVVRGEGDILDLIVIKLSRKEFGIKPCLPYRLYRLGQLLYMAKGGFADISFFPFIFKYVSSKQCVARLKYPVSDNRKN